MERDTAKELGMATGMRMVMDMGTAMVTDGETWTEMETVSDMTRGLISHE